jgi:hypothetical protein
MGNLDHYICSVRRRKSQLSEKLLYKRNSISSGADEVLSDLGVENPPKYWWIYRQKGVSVREQLKHSF